MKPILLSILLIISGSTFSQNFKEKELKTEVAEVTLFLNSAQIFEKGSATLNQGKVLLRIKNLSPFLDPKSIQVKAEGDFTILSVNHKLNFLKELKKDDKIDSLNKIVESLIANITESKAMLEVLIEKQSLLDLNKKLGGENSGTTVTQLKLALDFYDVEFSKIKQEEIRINRSIVLKSEQKKKIESQLKEIQAQKTLPSSEIEIRLNADSQETVRFSVSYLVSNAGWYPKYDVRVKNVKSPLDLTYKAEVYQNTGVDWKNVRLRFSNGDPRQSGVIPELMPWNLNYAQYTFVQKSAYGVALTNVREVFGTVLSEEDGSVLPGVNVVVKGTTIGTVTDANGQYQLTLPNEASVLVFSFIGLTSHEEPIIKPEMNVALASDATQLSEVVVTGYGLSGATAGVQIRGISSLNYKEKTSRIIPTTMIENQTTVEISIDTPYSIKSNGDKLTVDLKKYPIDATYQYYTIPKLDKDAFLIAQVVNWDQYNLLQGEANLYFEDAYIGRTILDAKALKDTLTISLGRDKNIVIGRIKNEQFTKRRTLGGNAIESRGFITSIRNKKSLPINIKIFDQIPVSVNSDISVNALEISKGQLDEKTGKIFWDLEINPQQQKDLQLQYEVKYPKREKIILE
ncbi:MAG: mucoidy inhibitor MuiA family protein [Cyclobacteriaceae bacterium]|nr:mucoidy inhibitor MuiA family protein [Cyclobacteriaceae bacterium]